MVCTFCLAGSVLIVFLIYKLLDRILRIPYIGRYSDRYILITGCDSGIGLAAVRRLDSLGCHVFAGCLTEKGETEVSKSCSDRVVPIALDVTKPDNVRRAFKLVSDRLNADGKDLWGVVNNAGMCDTTGPSDWMHVDDYQRTLGVNLLGPIDVTSTFLPLIKRCRGGGRIVNTSSVVGRIAFDSILPYCVSKHALEAYSDGLRRSLRRYGCKVSIIEPAGFKTNLGSREYAVSAVENSWNQATPEIKEEYGEDYFRFVRDSAGNKVNSFSDCLDPVVDAYVHAVLGRFPRARYLCGGAGGVIFTSLATMPEWLSDWVIAQTSFVHKTRPARQLRQN